MLLRPRRPFAIGFTALTLSAAIGFAPSIAEAKKGKAKAKIDKVCAEISCTEDQKKEVAQIFEQLHMDIKPDKQALKDLRKQLAREWAKAKPSERTLASLTNKIAAHERNIADRKLEAMLELHPVLSAEQREVIADKLLARGRKK